jgi:two-component system chemotaxis response regulator CheY
MIALVVDDSAVIRHIANKALRAAGWEVQVAADGAAGLAALESMPACDLLLTDWHMPVLDGIDLVRKVRSHERFSALRIVMVSSDAVLESLEAALAAGANDFVMKPFTTESLTERIDEVMRAS